MTIIKVNPAKLHGIASSVYADRDTIDACTTAAKEAHHNSTVGIGSRGDAFSALAKAAGEVCDAAHSWFYECGNSVAALSRKASSAADTYKHVDHEAYVPGPGGKPAPLD
jgi:phage-related minor tail protein